MHQYQMTYVYSGRLSTFFICDTKHTIFVICCYFVGTLKVISFEKDFIIQAIGVVSSLRVLSLSILKLLGSFTLSDLVPISSMQHVKDHLSAKN